MTDLSIVVPVYNEEVNVSMLYRRINEALKKEKFSYEIIFVDDGSSDNTFSIIKKIANSDKKLKVIKFMRNFGQTAAFYEGFQQAKGKIIISMDGDLQNDPFDIPRLVKKLDEGYDAVCGWRYNRIDSFSKKFVSAFANIFRKMLTKEKIHDSGCSLRAYKASAIKSLDLFGEMHRYIPSLLLWKGFKITEIKVNHLPRMHGKTKYNFTRLLKGGLDLIMVKFWRQYSARPMHLFGGLGITSFLLGSLTGLYLAIMRLFYGVPLSNRPLLLLAILLVILGVQLFVLGFLADIMIKTYYKDKKYYEVEEVIN